MSTLATLSLSRLPVAFRPYPDEALTSWLSRAAAAYGCTSRELLYAYRDFEREQFENVDLQPNPAALDFIQVLVGASINKLRACTLTTVYPHWIPNWISRTPPLWHTNECRTVTTIGLCPAICPFCLIEDLQSDRSQHLRLSWYCSITTVCPIHLSPLFTCCSGYSSESLAHGQDRLQSHRLYRTGCRGVLDLRYNSTSKSDPQALFQVAQFERLLRSALANERILILGKYSLASECLLLFAEDMARALMRPLVGSQYRILHALQTPQFRVPSGFNTPVDVPSWLSSGSLVLRRSIIAILANLVLSEISHCSLGSEGIRGRAFWKTLRSLQDPNDGRTLRDRAVCWGHVLPEVVEFYW